MKAIHKAKNIKKILLLTTPLLAILSIGTLAVTNNFGNINEKLANSNITVTEESAKTTIDSEKILANYSVQTETASEEAISRSAKARERANYISIDQITISKNMDLTVRCNVSREDFITLISNVKADTSGFFEENAGTIYDLCEKYNINEIFFCGLISAESGWDIASNHRRTNNFISLMSSSGSLIQFSSVEEGLEKAAYALSNNYLSETGRFYCGKTLESVRTRFCPVNPNWTNLVFGRMQQIV